MRLSPSPSIGGRLGRSLVLWAVLWCAVLGAAAWVIVQEEVDELLDDSLQSAAEGLVGPLALGLTEDVDASTVRPASKTSGRFTWQLVSHQGQARLVSSARGAPVAPLHDTPKPGFSDVPGWRVYGQATGRDGQMVYVAQTTEERVEASTGIALATLFAGAPMTLLAVLWLRSRIHAELEPLRDLSERLAHYDPMQPGATLGAAEREELRPVHAAIDALAGRLTRRIAHERAFTSHAAHALRTPLAGIDAQLAVALREAEPSHRAAPAAGAHGGRTAAARRRCAAGHVPQRRRSAAKRDRRRRARRPASDRGAGDGGARHDAAQRGRRSGHCGGAEPARQRAATWRALGDLLHPGRRTCCACTTTGQGSIQRVVASCGPRSMRRTTPVAPASA